MDKQTALEILELEQNATKEAIRAAYKALALKYHPDKNSDKEEGVKAEYEEKFKQINSAYETLTQDSTNSSFDSPPRKSPANTDASIKAKYLQGCRTLLQTAALNFTHLEALFEKSTEIEACSIFHNLEALRDYNCLGQASLDLLQNHLNLSNQQGNAVNPHVSKFIFEALVARANLKISHVSDLSHYAELLEAFKKYSSSHLVTQERLNQLIQYSSVAYYFAETIISLHHFKLLTPTNEALILDYLSNMGESMFATLRYKLLNVNKTKTGEILADARSQLEQTIHRKKNFPQIIASNMQRIRKNKEEFEKQQEINTATRIDLTTFKEKYKKWQNSTGLFNLITPYVEQGVFWGSHLNCVNSAEKKLFISK